MDSKNNTNIKVEADAILGLQATLLSHQDFEHAMSAFVTELALKMGYAAVSIGFLDNHQVDIVAISHAQKVEKHQELSRALAAAAIEAIEQNTILMYPESHDATPRITLAQGALSSRNNHQICTIPLTANQSIFGAMVFERGRDIPINSAELSTLEQTLSLISPILLFKYQKSHSLTKQLKQRMTGAWKENKSKTGFLRILAYALPVLLFLLSFIPAEYRVSAPAHIEGLVQRALVAPDDGFLQQTYAEAGDRVKENQVLVELSDKDLLLGKSRWESELAQYENAYGTALARSDRVQMVVNQTKIEETRAQIELAQQNLERAKITAPFDGIIIKGDLKQSLGAPVQRGDVLLTIAPVGKFRLMIEVDERDIAEVALKQAGKLALVSVAGKTYPFSVINITPVANTKEGRNFFVVEAAIEERESDSQLRPGLEGVAKMNAGSRPFIWIWTHRMTDWLKFTLWTWGLW